jgi:hypothetical protein
LSFQADVVPEISPYDFIAQRNLAGDSPNTGEWAFSPVSLK